tara:strand:+ start:1158 stop:1334 length:177 start_codon:yes stop_codon:yes gene_type:complete
MKKVAEQEVAEQKVEEQAQPTEMVMSLELAQGIANYLGARPYQEVAELIKGLQGSKVQ